MTSPDTPTVDPLSRTFSALADPTRRALLARLARGPATVSELAEPFSMSQPAISRHLKVLERAGLVRASVRAQWRPRELDAAPLRDVSEYVQAYGKFWSDKLDQLDDYLQQIQHPDKETP